MQLSMALGRHQPYDMVYQIVVFHITFFIDVLFRESLIG